jgi:hypothetical protein
VSEGEGDIGLGGLGTVGKGGGGGSGMGYGRGVGRLSGRRASAPQVVAGGMAALASIVRERFPPTLHFSSSIPLDPSGKTRLALPLSDAVTTYQVEAVVWSADGWTWSAGTRLRVDQDVVIDAPVPTLATVGDVLRLPVRVGNRTARDQRVTLAVLSSGEATAAPLHERAGLVVPAGDSVQVPVELRLTRPQGGGLLLVARAGDGTPLDAARRPLVVERAARRVRLAEETLAAGAGSLQLDVPARAIAREGAEIQVRVGVGLFDAPTDPESAAWAEAWSTRPPISPDVVDCVRSCDYARLARAVAAVWAAGAAVSDHRVRDALTRLTRNLDTVARNSRLREQVEILLGLAPIVASGQHRARPARAAGLEAILRTLRRQVSSRVGEVADDPALWASAAAALAWTAPAGADHARVRELVRRVRRHQLHVGSITWVAVGGPSTSALLALAELKLHETQRAFALVRTLRQKGTLEQESLALARAAAALLARGASPRSVSLRVDGRERRLELSGGLARIAAPELSRPGRHQVRVEVPAASAPVHLQVVTEYGLPWSILPESVGPLAVSVEGAIGARDQRSGLALRVRNLSPRTIGLPVLELGLPAGAELDEEGRAALRRRTVAEPAASRGTLRLMLPSLPPGAVRCLPLPLRWSIGGRLQGLGVVAYAADRPEDISVVQPRVLNIPDSTERQP